MFSITVTTQDRIRQSINAAVEKAAYKNFFHAAASISKDAKASIVTSRVASAVGRPPHTKRGLLRRAIRFKADREGAVIGPLASIGGTVGAAHEFGGTYKGQPFEQRPFMGPALERGIPRFAGSWRGSIGE